MIGDYDAATSKNHSYLLFGTFLKLFWLLFIIQTIRNKILVPFAVL